MKKAIAFLLLVTMLLSCALFAPASAEEPNPIWNGVSKTEPAGSGTEASPYLISNGAELAYIADAVNAGIGDFRNAYYRQTADILLNNVADFEQWTATTVGLNSWIPIGKDQSFTGTYDGNGFIISGMYINNADNEFVGLFGFVSGGTLKNINLLASYINVTTGNKDVKVGGIASRIGDGATVEHCTSATTIRVDAGTAKYMMAGGIVAFAGNGANKVLYSANLGNIKTVNTGSWSYAGGVVGGAMDTVSNSGLVAGCYNAGSIDVDNDKIKGVGGIIGWEGDGNDSGTVHVEDCLNVGAVKGNANWAIGGIIGFARSTCHVNYCVNTGSVTTADGMTAYNIRANCMGTFTTKGNYYNNDELNRPGGNATPLSLKNGEMVSQNMTDLSAERWILESGKLPMPKGIKASFASVLGAQIRRNYTEFFDNGQKVAEGQGIRFGAELTDAEKYISGGVLLPAYEVGILVARKSTLGTASLTEANAEHNIFGEKSFAYNAETKTITFSGYVVGIDKDNYDTEFVSRAYVKLNGKVLFYTDALSRSVNAVANSLGLIANEYLDMVPTVQSYRIVYPGTNNTLKELGDKLSAAINQKLGKKLTVISDTVPAEEGRYEILIGKTNRTPDEVNPAKDLATFKSVGDNFVILGGTQLDISRAVDKIIENFDQYFTLYGIKIPKQSISYTFQASSSYKFMSFNLLYSAGKGDPSADRVAEAKECILSVMPDTFGVQECQAMTGANDGKGWYNILVADADINKYYSAVVLGYDYYTEEGQNTFNLIFYRKDKFELLDSYTKWYCDSGLTDVKGSHVTYTEQNDTARILTYALLKDKTTGYTFAHFNTHLGIGRTNMQKELAILKNVTSLCSYPYVVTGDFNVGWSWTEYGDITATWQDARLNSAITTNDTTCGASVSSSCDYALAKKNSGMVFEEYDVCNDPYRDKAAFNAGDTNGRKVFISDHYPIWGRFYVENPAK